MTIQIPRPVFGKFVFCFDTFDQMVDVFLTHIFYPKIVHNQCERDGACGMLPQAGGVWTFKISVGEQTLLQQFICQKYRPGGVPTLCGASQGKQTRSVQVCPNYIAFISFLEKMLTEFSYICIY
jgi:hypothetical protein